MKKSERAPKQGPLMTPKTTPLSYTTVKGGMKSIHPNKGPKRCAGKKYD